MAGSSLFALLDDITTLLDDVALLSKMAMKKTTGVLGDDLALNAQQTSGFAAERELPVVWAVAKGSLVNKLILVPSALLISAFAPKLILPLLMIGGAYLCFEGVEKVAHQLLHGAEDTAHREVLAQAVAEPEIDLVALERTRVKGAIRTDFILSAEIVVIALGTMADAPITQQVVSLSLIGLALTVFVYGLVAAIVKLDDLGLKLLKGGASSQRVGRAILVAAPRLMKLLSVGGTVAMFLVGGSIVAHGAPPVEHLVEGALVAIGAHEGWLASSLKMVLECLVGLVVGAVVLAFVELAQRLRAKMRATAAA
jgi:predicted DNA repair protein MutK